MINPSTLLKKQIAKNKIYPAIIAESYLKKKWSVKKIAFDLNKFFKKDVLTPSEVEKVLLDVKKTYNKVKNPSVSLKKMEYYATRSIVSNTIIQSISKSSERGKKGRWLPSGSHNPSLAHMENYGEIFDLDEGIGGELPAERPNCQCGLSIIQS